MAVITLNRTIGTVDEVTQLVDAVVWNARVPGEYYKVGEFSGEEIHAMVRENGNAFEVAKGIAEGRYELDLIGAITDYAWSQTLDRMYGRVARGAQDTLNLHGYDSPLGVQTGPCDDQQEIGYQEI